MPYFYRATGAYGGLIAGHRYEFSAGDVIEIPDVAHIGPLVRDGAGIDFERALTADDLAEHRRVKAAAERAEHERRLEARRVVREWADAWEGPHCPGSPGNSGPHDVPAHPADPGSGLRAEWVDDPGHWVVACVAHIGRWVKSGAVPPAPPVVDRTARRCRVAADYRSQWSGPMRDTDAMAGRVRQFGGVIRLVEGEVVDVVGYLADWIERDAPGTLVPVDAAPSTPVPRVDPVAKPARRAKVHDAAVPELLTAGVG